MGDILQFASPPVVGREHTDPWYEVQDLIGRNLYDTPDGGPLAADEEHLLPYMEEEFGREFTGQMLLPQLAVARILPQDIFVPTDHVIAMVGTAIGWNKALNISWMQMDYEELTGSEVPIQHHANGFAVYYLDDDLAFLGGATPDDMKPVRIQTDCVTNIGWSDLLPTPLSAKEKAALQAAAADVPAGCQIDG